MNTITQKSPLDQYRADTSAEPAKGGNELGQKAFLKLMITQLEHQDPLSPQDNTQFIAQLAQFSSVESLDSLNNNFDRFTSSFASGNAMQGAALVGRTAAVSTDRGRVSDGAPLQLMTELPVPAQNVKLTVTNAAGEPIRQIPLGPRVAGELSVKMQGTALTVNGVAQENWGDPLPAGNYQFKVTGDVAGEPEQFETFISARIESVGIARGGAMTLNVEGVGAKTLADLKAIYQ